MSEPKAITTYKEAKIALAKALEAYNTRTIEQDPYALYLEVQTANNLANRLLAEQRSAFKVV